MANRIEVIIDVIADKMGSIRKFRTDLREAEGAAGKFKLAAGGAMQYARDHAAQLAAAGGAALLAFGVKAVHAFEDTAKAALDLGAAVGLSVEDASRWIGVADDFKVSAADLTSGLGKIGKTLDDAKWAKYGIATRDAGGNARNVNDILTETLAMLSSVRNATDRTRIGNELFGKGYASLTPLIGHTKEQYEKMLGSVEKGQVITKKEAEKAEKMRLAEDQLSDAIKEVTLAVGQAVAGLAPYVSKLAEIVGLVDKLPDGWFDQLIGPPGAVNNSKNELTNYVNALYAAAAASGDFTGYLVKQGYSLQFAERAQLDYNAALDENAGATTTSTQVNRDHASALDNTSEAASETERETRRLSSATDDQWRASRAMADQLAKEKDALKNLQDQELTAIDKTFALVHATQANDRAHADYLASLKDSKATEQDRNEAFVNATEAAYTQAKAFADLEKQNGNVSSSIDLMRVSLQQQADKLGPNDPLRKGIEALIAQLDAIPQAVPPPLKITLDAQIMADTKSKLGALIALIKSVGTAGSSLVIGQLGGKSKPTNGFRARGTEGFGAASDLTTLLTSGGAGSWELAQTAATADGEPDAITLARRQYQRGRISYEQYVKILEDEKAKHAEFSDDEEAIYEELQSLAEAHAQAIADAQKAQQDAIDATTEAIEEQTAAWLANDNAQQDLLDAVAEQSAAQDAYNAALAHYNDLVKHGGSAEDRAKALQDVAAAQSDLDKKTIEGAKARAALVGAKGTAAYENSLHDDLLAYVASHGDPTGALTNEANRHDLGGLSTGQAASNDSFLSGLAPVLRQAFIDALSTVPVTRLADITTAQRTATRAAT